LPPAGEFFSAAGAGISAAEREYRAYWRPHIQNSHRRILQAADLVRSRSAALVLGAGRCREIPLEELARRFERVVLVDLDLPSMEQAAGALPEELRPKVEIRVSDVTSFAQPVMDAARRIVEGAATTEEAFGGLERLTERLDALRRPPELPRADLVISSLVLSELPRYPRAYAARLIERKLQASLSEWDGYAKLGDRLRRLAREDHAELLSRFRRPGGIVYFAGTVARGPEVSRSSRQQMDQARADLAGRLARLGLLAQLRQQPEDWRLLRRVFLKLSGSADGNAGVGAEQAERDFDTLVRQVENGAGPPRRAAILAEAASRLLCQGRLPAAMETRAYEAIAEAHRDRNPGALTPLLDAEAFLKALERRRLAPAREPQQWWWLEYACSIPRKPGAFAVRSWILKPTDE